MLTNSVVLIGSGGHAKVVADALLRSGRTRSELIVLDQAEQRIGGLMLGFEIERYAVDRLVGRSFHVCIGDNPTRLRFLYFLLPAMALTVIHPLASIAEQCRIGRGCFLAAQAVVGPDADIGMGCIVNHGAVVDHDASIGEGCHIGPGATLGGGVRLGTSVLVGAGANVLPGISVGNGTVIGAGAVVSKHVPANVVWAGVPAREIQ